MSASDGWVLASGNPGKLRELNAALAPLKIDLRPLSDWTLEGAQETGCSFEENALLKARHACALAGRPALADDSGIEVAALKGAPGIHSARYAGTHGDDDANNLRLLRDMAEQTDRRARFRCVIVLVRRADDPQPLICDGVWNGELLRAPRGTGGFGYDPLFLDPQLGRSGGELSRDEKLRVSHRGRAVAELIRQLRNT